MKRAIIEKITPSLLGTNYIRRYLEESSKNSFRIIYYHFISDKKEDYYFKNKGISVSEFTEQLDYFKKRFNIIKLSDAVEMQAEGVSLDGSLAITTDDGFSENYHTIAPILDEHNLSASIFIATDFIDNKDLMWRNKLVYLINRFPKEKILKESALLSNSYFGKAIQINTINDLMSWSLKEWGIEDKDILSKYLWDKFMPPVEEFLESKKPYLSTTQIKDLHSSGFDICSHSCSHPDLSKASWDQYKDEVLNSILKLEQITGDERFSFSYPFGKRASLEFERRLTDDYENISSMLGIINSNRNSKNPNSWERDLQEDSKSMAQFRFLILPIVRKYF